MDRFLSRKCLYFIPVILLSSLFLIWRSTNSALIAFPSVSDAQNKTPYSVKCLNPAVQASAQKLGVKAGYVLAFRYWEQQTQAAMSLLQLQCFAHSQNLQLVEPFLRGSSFSLHFENFSEQLPLRFSDLVDVDFWNKQTEEMGFGKLATWEDFVTSAPRAIITVCMKYRDPGHLHQTIAGFDFRTGCSTECMVDGFNSSLRFLNRYGFRTVKSACTNFAHYAGAVKAESFMLNVLGNHQPGEVTVVMNEFRGFFGLYRAEVLTECGLKHFDVPLHPSASVLHTAEKYIESQLYNRPYIAILVRVERIALHLHQSVPACTREVSGTVQELVSAFNLSKRFLAMDIGRFGSGGIRTEEDMVGHGKSFIQAVYGDRWSFEQWEASFENASLYSNPAFVANFQRTVASKARCLVLVGGGGFQLQAKLLYLKHHLGSGGCIRMLCHTHA